MKYTDLKNSQEKQSHINIISDYQPSMYYPYGELPLKYTKSYQEQLKKELENKTSVQEYNIKPDIEYNNANNNQVNQQQVMTNNMDNNLDFKSMLPLLSSLSGNNDMIKQLIPLINNNGNMNMADLLKLFTSMKKTKTSSETIITTDNYIDSLKKIE